MRAVPLGGETLYRKSSSQAARILPQVREVSSLGPRGSLDGAASTESSPGGSKPKLLDQVRSAIRARHYSRRTEKAYVFWVRRFVIFHRMRHPAEMGEAEVAEFLTSLAVRNKVSASTQNQALAAILFLYKRVLDQELEWMEGIVRAKMPQRLPMVLNREEVQAVMGQLHGIHRLMGTLLYGSGLRVLECLRLRVKDIDFGQNLIVVREGKGDKDRTTLLPESARKELPQQLRRVEALHAKELERGLGWVELPEALALKYPRAGRELAWQWVFPASRPYRDDETGQVRRHHLHETVLQRAIHEAVRAARLTKSATPHTFRHCFATHLLEDGYDIRTVQELMGHRDVKTTMIYCHVMNRGPLGVRSPADRLGS